MVAGPFELHYPITEVSHKQVIAHIANILIFHIFAKLSHALRGNSKNNLKEIDQTAYLF